MPTSFTAATTRTAGAVRKGDRSELLPVAHVITSPETQLSYQIEGLLGEGGFGQVYLARRVGRSSSVPEVLCIKVSQRIDGWLREAYFGQLLDGHPRAIRVFDAFPITATGRSSCTALRSSTRSTAISARSSSATIALWAESVARREIAGVLEVLGKLHRGQMLHRDLTPMNVFVCDSRRLKLGDFGIVRQQSDRRGITARTMNALTAPSEFLAARHQSGRRAMTCIRSGNCSRCSSRATRRCAFERPMFARSRAAIT